MPVVNSVTTPVGVIRPMPPFSSVNHRLPSGPVAIPSGRLPGVIPAENSWTAPAGVMSPMRPASSANQTLPSGPPVMPRGPLLGLMPAGVSSVAIGGDGVRTAILPVCSSVNHILPSGPRVISQGRLLVLIPEPVEKSSTLPSGRVTRPKRLPETSVNHTLPSGPPVIPSGLLEATSSGNSVTVVARAGAASDAQSRADAASVVKQERSGGTRRTT